MCNVPHINIHRNQCWESYKLVKTIIYTCNLHSCTRVSRTMPKKTISILDNNTCNKRRVQNLEFTGTQQ
jgi:hypothetical protein